MFGAVYRITVEGGGEPFSCRCGERVLIAMERAGRAQIPTGCRGGGCGVCKVRVLSGSYVTGKMSRAHVSERDEEQGYALACRLFPESDLHLEAVGTIFGAASGGGT
jgi:ferredoxin